jgi:hypothetical protein
MGMGLIGTMAAVVLDLMLASAKSSYDTQKGELNALSAKMLLLDRILAHYGPDAREARDVLRGVVAGALDRVWPKDGSRVPIWVSPRLAASSLRKDSRAFAEERRATLREIPGTRRNTLVDRGTAKQLNLHAVHHRRSCLAYGYFHEFRPHCASQRDGGYCSVNLCAIGFDCDFLDPSSTHHLRE